MTTELSQPTAPKSDDPPDDPFLAGFACGERYTVLRLFQMMATDIGDKVGKLCGQVKMELLPHPAAPSSHDGRVVADWSAKIKECIDVASPCHSHVDYAMKWPDVKPLMRRLVELLGDTQRRIKNALEPNPAVSGDGFVAAPPEESGTPTQEEKSARAKQSLGTVMPILSALLEAVRDLELEADRFLDDALRGAKLPRLPEPELSS